MRKAGAIFGIFLLSLVLVPNVAAAVAATPGSTTTIMGMPVSQRITGLTADTAYYLDCETSTSTEADQSLTADSAGVISLSVAPTVYGANLYNLTLTDANGASQITFTVNNMNIIPYILPLIVIAVLFGIMKSVRRMV